MGVVPQDPLIHHTLKAFGIGDPLTSFSLDANTGIILLGTADGAVYMAFPRSRSVPSAATLGEDVKAHDKTEEVAIDMNVNQCQYDLMVLRKRTKEGIRALSLDEKNARVIAVAGDVAIMAWNLHKLETITLADGSTEAKCEMFVFNRQHTFGTCSNAFLFIHKVEVVLVIQRSISAYSLIFPDGDLGAKCDPVQEEHLAPSTTGEVGEASIADVEIEDAMNSPMVSAASAVASAASHAHSRVGNRAQPEQKEFNLTTPPHSIPSAFSGDHLVFVTGKSPGEFLIEVRAWGTEENPIVRTFTVKRAMLDAVPPYAVQCCGDFIMGVVNLSVLCLWSIKSGEQLHALTGHKFGSKIVSARLVIPREDLGVNRLPVLLSIGTDGRLLVWQDGVLVQSLRLPKAKRHFALGVPYFLEPTLARNTDSGKVQVKDLVWNDDTGVHIARFR